MRRPQLHLDVVLDVVCPWCFLGKRRLDAVIEELAGEIDLLVAYRPFQLDPTVPKQGVDRDEYLVSRFGDRHSVEETHARLVEMGEDVGIRFAFETIERMPNTIDAHRLIRWASQSGVAAAMVERLFSLYFEEGADLSDAEVLVSAADDVGLDTDDISERLDSDVDFASVNAEIAHAGRIGITGVPCVIVERKFAISGAQPTDIMIDAFRKIASELESDAG